MIGARGRGCYSGGGDRQTLHTHLDAWQPVAPRQPLRLLALALSTSLGLGSAPVFAAPAKSTSEEPIDTEALALDKFNEGQTAYDRGDYKQALDLFLEAQSLYPSPVFHYNIGRCYEALENYDQAITSYNAYIRSTKTSTGTDPEDKTNVENTIARLEKLRDAQEAEDAAARNKDPVIIIKETIVDAKNPGRGLLIVGGVLTGVGVGVAAVGGGLFGSRAASVSKQLDPVYSGNPDQLTLAEARDLDSQGRSAELGQILSMSIGSAIAVAGIALLVAGGIKKSKRKPASAVDTAPVEVERPSARLLPVLSPGGTGFVLQGRF